VRQVQHDERFAEDGTARILDAYYYIYNKLGWGFLEVVYRRSMVQVLRRLGASVAIEVPQAVRLDGEVVGEYRADLVVDGKVLVELKAADRLAPEHRAQVINYLRASGLETGLLLNFGPKPEFKRIVLSRHRPS
jgi:GxxExxY protein